MKTKIFFATLFASSILLANPNAATNGANAAQTPTANGANQQSAQDVQHPSMYPFPMQMQPMQNGTAQPNTTPNSQAMQNAYGGNYGGGLDKIFAKVNQMYPGAMITDVDYEGFGYQIEVNGGLELFFDMNGNLMWQQWDY